MKIILKTADELLLTDSFKQAIESMFEYRKANKPAVIVLMK